ncbi:MAG TPA: hypothetical protein VGJ21_21860 [Terracidiphilus sp.]|jgi:hypothetical protein
MKVIINNIDYTSALDATQPMIIERTLNAPSVCQVILALPQDGSLVSPIRSQPISVCGDGGAVYFTGYIVATPLPEYAGQAIDGPRYRLVVRALSDEILLDQTPTHPSNGIGGTTAGSLLSSIATHKKPAILNTTALTLTTPVSHFLVRAAASFSKSAGQIASQVRGAYRAQSGALSLSAIPVAVHQLNEGDGSLALANLTLAGSLKRALANDITVCGELEAAAYVTEVFHGDGATDSFCLAMDPYYPPASQTAGIAELFNEPAIDDRVWSNPTGNTCFTLGAGGLVINGGTGVDGQAELAWIDPVEMGGTLLLEAEGISLANASAGILAAFYSGTETSSSCVAGFQCAAQPSTGAVAIQPLVNGAACGASMVLNPANQYTLRIRVHCPEQQRALTTYLSCGDNGLVATGGQFIVAPARLLFEIQETVNGVAAMPLTLYDGSISSLPTACRVVAASSINLSGSMRALRLSSLGSAWVVSTPVDGVAFTRRLGTAAESAECSVGRSGRLVFSTGNAPAVGEQIAVTYRTMARAAGRQANTSNQQGLAAQGLPATVSWLGSVTNPPARSSADCRNAAAALAQAAASNSAFWSGVYRATSFDVAGDVWPGDALALNAPSCNLNAQVIVRSVKLSYHSSVPDYFTYEIAFANDWAEDLAIHTSTAVPVDAWLPAPVAPAFAANLSSLTVTAISGNTVTVNTGAAAPVGGGFEIRTRDFAFMAGEDPSLVMRGSQPNLTFTRQCAADRFYIRMFDGADPPNYSEFSAALFLNLPCQ